VSIGTVLQSRRAAWKSWFSGLSRIGRLSVRLLFVMAGAVALRTALVARGLMLAVVILCIIPLAPLLLILLYRWITRQVLWKVRNRLILTYLLMGLAPIILFASLGGIAIYLLGGQYATSSALSLLDESLVEVSDETVNAATFTLADGAPKRESASAHPAAGSPEHLVTLWVLKGTAFQPAIPAAAGADAGPFGNQAPPAWMHAPFRGIVALRKHLYLCSEQSVQQPGAGSVLLLGTRPLDAESVGEITKDLGKIIVFANSSDMDDEPEDIDVQGVNVRVEGVKHNASKAKDSNEKDDHSGFAKVKGGVVAEPASMFDPPVIFSSPLPITSWQTGDTISSMVVVISRPSVLYKRLFASSVVGGVVVRIVLISLASFFAILELLAVLMAVGLSRTITRSVADLTRGTLEIDRGNLAHRVRVTRHDQLGDLARSFNGMAASISELLVQQREKDRLLNELAIAKEVQSTLFPASPVSMPGIEMHAVCVPAQTVGGDYFDFIFRTQAAGMQGNSLCLALGDISGKGISAALLMASLHSAVRVYSLDSGADQGALLSPSLLLGDINRHLYSSTQSARYATLFIACYDTARRSLTYSNGGHLPPLVLSKDGTVRRLECGGPVVGLLGGMAYSEASVPLEPGDLLIAFTDGITEPEHGTEEFGEARLLECIRPNQAQPLPVIMADTLKAVRDWIGDREQPDDITLLLARQL
jgi:sigma-B regulation protein RsbU (phosphoserine phosphatase)